MAEWSIISLRESYSHFRTDQLANHERRILQTIIIVIVVAGWRGSLGSKHAPAASVGASAIGVLGIKGVNNDGLSALNFTATERATLSFWFLREKRTESEENMHMCLNRWMAVGSSALPARLWDRKCTWGGHRARSSHPCHSQHRSYTAGRWSPSHSRVHIAPVGDEWRVLSNWIKIQGLGGWLIEWKQKQTCVTLIWSWGEGSHSPVRSGFWVRPSGKR